MNYAQRLYEMNFDRRDRADAGPAARGDGGGHERVALRATRQTAIRTPSGTLQRTPQTERRQVQLAGATRTRQLIALNVQNVGMYECTDCTGRNTSTLYTYPLL